MTGFDRAQAVYDADVPDFYDHDDVGGDYDDRYGAYVQAHLAALRADWENEPADDRDPFPVWVADDPPTPFDEWLENELEGERLDAAENAAEARREAMWE